jgi:hypothetical protein
VLAGEGGAGCDEVGRRAQLAAALIVRVLGLLLPRRLRDRGGVLALLFAVIVLITQSLPWAVLLCVGLPAPARWRLDPG